MTHAAFVKLFHSYNVHVFTAAEPEQPLNLYAKSTRLLLNIEGNDYNATPQAQKLANLIGIVFYEAPHFNAPITESTVAVFFPFCIAFI